MAVADPAEDSVTETSVSDKDLPFTEVVPERPYRVAVSGYELHRELEKIIGLPVSLTNNVWIWPFKHFITYELKIRQRLTALQTVIGDIDEERLRSIEAEDECERNNASTNGARDPNVTAAFENVAQANEKDEIHASSLRLEVTPIPTPHFPPIPLGLKVLFRATAVVWHLMPFLTWKVNILKWYTDHRLALLRVS